MPSSSARATDLRDPTVTYLYDFMGVSEGWGREQGRTVYGKLLDHIESNPGTMIYRVSLSGVRRTDISFASETIVELARRYRGTKGFALIDVDDPDMLENWEAAAIKKKQPIMVWIKSRCHVIGPEPLQGAIEAFQFVISRPQARAAEFVQTFPNVSIANASTKFKQLWEQGFVLRREQSAESGGTEYVYVRIG